MFYNRLVSVYGKNFSELGLNRIKWDAYSGDLIQLSLFEIKNTQFNSSEIFSDLSNFKNIFLKKLFETKDELQIIFSNSVIFNEFSKLLEVFLSSLKNTKLSMPKIRLLIPKDKHVISYFGRLQLEDYNSLEINYIHEHNFRYFMAIIDKVALMFSEININEQNLKQDTFFNVISADDALIWYNTTVFETLWKQSILEKRVSNMSEKLDDNNISNNNLIRILAHELKNPIQPILGFSNMIQTNTRLSPDQKNELLKIISRNARKLDILTNNILDYARMENNIFNLNIESIDIIKVIEDLLSDYSLQVNKKNIQFDFIFAHKPLVIRADKIRLIEVLDNLISNSIKFTEKGQIKISIKVTQQFLTIDIIDSGCGINLNESHRLFNKFFTTDKLGTGLGLYISKMIVDKHRGIIEGKNNENGIGSTFTVKLPL